MADLKALIEKWLEAERAGRRHADELYAMRAYESYTYERGKADARGFCAEELSALLDGERQQQEQLIEDMKDALQLAFNDGAFHCPMAGRERSPEHVRVCTACSVRAMLTGTRFLRDGADAKQGWEEWQPVEIRLPDPK